MKTIKSVEIIPVWFDESLPENKDIEFGKLYITRKYKGAKHKCLCGCGVDTYINLNSINSDKVNDYTDGWALTTNRIGEITLAPSLFHTFECKSHYIITNNIANFV